MKFLEKYSMLVLIVGVLGVSVSAIFVRFAEGPSVVLAAWRLLWSALLLAPTTLLKKETRDELFHINKKTLLISCAAGVFLAFHFILWFESLNHTSVASSTALVNTEVIWVSIGFCLVLRGKLSWKAILAIAVAFFGSILIALSDSAEGGGHLYGDILATLAAMAAAIYMLTSRVTRKTTSTTVYTCILYTATATTLVLISLLQGENLFAYGWNPVLVGLALAVFSTIMGHSIFSWAMKFYAPSFVSACKLCEPVVAAIIAIFAFGEVPGFLQVAGGLIIIGGVYYYSRLERAAEQANSEEAA